ncbi:MAG: hypothetical protein AAF570_18000, partial [Bacteroidota bacterium]
HIDWATDAPQYADLFDQNGRHIRSFRPNAGTQQSYATTELPRGLYHLVFRYADRPAARHLLQIR